ncbi:YdeI/OmpD-associated family protein [Luteibaculum oceani]|uniref:YdeI/OmpD-associated family protein n=1 Tax=Luteibaculum oceani TaxID=1294296 RepID=A0A5C6V243_9FLAO|nr:YdeI/OmpD-associated family protein [Luteibaculum oceani]TXC77115.1 YdeI/OmpD-associated family protein [Luteibaculum oceani]
MSSPTTAYKFFARIESMPSKVFNRHLLVPEEIAETLLSEHDRFICRINALEFPCAILKNKGLFQVLMNKENCDQLAASIGDELEIEIRPDTSKYGMPLPEELEYFLEEDPEFENFFEKLSPGKQRNLIYLVNKPKNKQSRLNKALAIVSHLKEFKGAIDFKALNETIKFYNNKQSLK